VVEPFLYRAVYGAFQLLGLRLRSSEHKELEMLSERELTLAESRRLPTCRT
jgi:hypothetical protein